MKSYMTKPETPGFATCHKQKLSVIQIHTMAE